MKDQTNWLKQVWMLKIWSVINCFFMQWTKKLTLQFLFLFFYIPFQFQYFFCTYFRKRIITNGAWSQWRSNLWYNWVQWISPDDVQTNAQLLARFTQRCIQVIYNFFIISKHPILPTQFCIEWKAPVDSNGGAQHYYLLTQF